MPLFFNCGQACSAHTRILASADQHDRFVAALFDMVEARKIGDPTDPETFIGPWVAKRQQDRVWDYIESGISEGATVTMGGPGMPPSVTRGHAVRPTVFSNVKNSMRIAREEIFGLVVCVISYHGIDDAVAIANDSTCGLAGGVWTADAAKGVEIARRIRTGSVSFNGASPGFRAPGGGFKESGIGREFGELGISDFTEHRIISLTG
jgi:aldehyde dehydrogenase (NAD+)